MSFASQFDINTKAMKANLAKLENELANLQQEKVDQNSHEGTKAFVLKDFDGGATFDKMTGRFRVFNIEDEIPSHFAVLATAAEELLFAANSLLARSQARKQLKQRAHDLGFNSLIRLREDGNMIYATPAYLAFIPGNGKGAYTQAELLKEFLG